MMKNFIELRSNRHEREKTSYGKDSPKTKKNKFLNQFERKERPGGKGTNKAFRWTNRERFEER